MIAVRQVRAKKELRKLKKSLKNTIKSTKMIGIFVNIISNRSVRIWK